MLVKEYEVVNQVLFQGNKSLKDPDLKRFISLKPNEPFNSAKLSADVNVIREAYKTVGRNDIAVTIQTINLGKGRVNVVFNIVEGRRTKISNITFKGNHAFGSSRLRDVISTKPSGILSLLLRGDVYSEERLAADEEALRRFTITVVMQIFALFPLKQFLMKRVMLMKLISFSMKVCAIKLVMFRLKVISMGLMFNL